MASVLENPMPMTSDPAPIMLIETIARTDKMWVVEVTDPAAHASIGGILSIVEKKETVDTQWGLPKAIGEMLRSRPRIT